MKRSALAMLGLAAPATLFLTYWTTAPLRVLGVIGITWAAGLGLLTRRPIGAWLGRLGAGVLMVTGVFVAWYLLLSGVSGGWLHFLNIIIGVSLPALLLGVGVGVLRALRSATAAHGRS